MYIIAFLPDRDVLGFPALGFLVAWLPTAYVNCPYHVYIYIYIYIYEHIYIYIYTYTIVSLSRAWMNMTNNSLLVR